MAEALDYAHSRGIVHRDLKPDNICLTENHRPKLFDFGIARNLHHNVDSQEVGCTPAYASPEQATGLPADERTDQYSLALIAYELLAGRRRLRRPAARASILDLHRHGEPADLRQWRPDLPEQAPPQFGRHCKRSPTRDMPPASSSPKPCVGDIAVDTSSSLQCRYSIRATHRRLPLPRERRLTRRFAIGTTARRARLLHLVLPARCSAWHLVSEPGERRHSSVTGRDSPDLTEFPRFSPIWHATSVRRTAWGVTSCPSSLGLTIEDFERHHPTWRPMLGPACVVELERPGVAETAARIVAAFRMLRVTQQIDSRRTERADSPGRRSNLGHRCQSNRCARPEPGGVSERDHPGFFASPQQVFSVRHEGLRQDPLAHVQTASADQAYEQADHGTP